MARSKENPTPTGGLLVIPIDLNKLAEKLLPDPNRYTFEQFCGFIDHPERPVFITTEAVALTAKIIPMPTGPNNRIQFERVFMPDIWPKVAPGRLAMFPLDAQAIVRPLDLADRAVHAGGTMTLKEFMGDRFDYNPRIRGNVRGLVDYVVYGKENH
jgi:hypothetical protein